MQQYAIQYKRFGVRNLQHLLVPVVSNTVSFEFPRSSALHYCDFDEVLNAPASSEYLLKSITKPIVTHHVMTLLSNKGTPRSVNSTATALVRQYHAKNKRFRFQADPMGFPKDPNTLMLYNYGWLHSTYKYTMSVYAKYYKWYNIQKTIWSTIDTVAQGSDRIHYVFADLPKIIPSLSSLKMFEKAFNQNMLKVFNTAESLFILELFKWMSGEDSRQESVLAGLGVAQMSKVVLCLRDKAKMVYINLGVINSFRKTQEQDSDSIVTNQQTISSMELQKRFLRMCLTLRQSSAQETIVEDEEEQDKEQEEEQNALIIRDTTVTQRQTEEDLEKEIELFSEEQDTDIESVRAAEEKLLMSMDEDLRQLEIIEKRSIVDIEGQDSADAKEYSTITLTDLKKEKEVETTLVQDIEQLAQDGVISAAEYKRLLESVNTYKKIDSPFTEGKKIEQDMVISPEDLELTSTELADIATVPDKSMLKSTLVDFDKKYIDKVYRKDILSMVVNLQKAGIVLQDYEVERVPQITGDVEVHTIRLKPLQGQSSTLRFNMPVVDSDGNFKINGSKYKLRKQRGEVPIRKTAPDMVALSSYYTKAFVQRSPKKVNNYEMWLCNEIAKKAMDAQDSSVYSLKPGNSFDNSIKAARVYTALSKRFRSFVASGHQFVFTQKELLQYVSKDSLDKLQEKEYTVCGLSKDGLPLVMDKNSTIYEWRNKTLEILGSMEDIAGLDKFQAPVDFAQVKIAGKYIPAAVVLAYYIGLDKLMELLKVTPKRIPTGQRYVLDEQEWQLKFNDETLVFNKEDKMASMVLAGFSEYHRTIKNFSSFVFNKRNVYLNLLEQQEIGARHLRELDLIDKLFVDPVTAGVLKEMGEPQSFRGLVFRSCEMLLDDAHPDVTDMQYMRIKGYERFAGAIYAELIASARAFSSKSAKSAAKLEMNPYAVWKRITQDPAVALLDEINPIENLKQMEAVTFAGTGGRIKLAMTAPTRVYHPSDMGVISEATKDSSDVAINTYLSANPKLKSLRGLKSAFDFNEDGPSSLLSTSALLAPGATNDD